MIKLIDYFQHLTLLLLSISLTVSLMTHPFFARLIVVFTQSLTVNSDLIQSEVNTQAIHLISPHKRPISTSVFFTQNEVSHLKDVRELNLINQILSISMFFVTCLTILTFRHSLKSAHKIQLALSLTTTTVLILIAFFSFDAWFTLFHQVLFFKGNWQFPADSLLIIHFNQNFWLIIFIIFAFSFLLLNLLLSRACQKLLEIANLSS